MNVSTKVRVIISFILTLLTLSLFAQAPDTMWTRTFGGIQNEEGRSVKQTMDGGYVITGSTNLFGTDGLWLLKTDAFGDTLWTKTYGGSASDFGYAVQQTTDSGYIITGYVEYPSWQSALMLVKTNANGDTLWTKKIGEIENGNVGFDVEQTLDGGYIVTGMTNFYLPPYFSDLLLVKVGPDASNFTPVSITYPFGFNIHQNYPNPFNPLTTIKYQIPELSFVSLAIYDILGNEVATLVNEEKQAGNYEIAFDGSTLPSGIYFYSLQATPGGWQAGNFFETKKMVLLR